MIYKLLMGFVFMEIEVENGNEEHIPFESYKEAIEKILK